MSENKEATAHESGAEEEEDAVTELAPLEPATALPAPAADTQQARENELVQMWHHLVFRYKAVSTAEAQGEEVMGLENISKYVLVRRKEFKLVGKRSGKLSICTKLTYGAPTASTLPVVVLIGVHSMAHYNRLGVQLAYVSLAVALARSLDVISDPAMSYATDSFKSMSGRRRPFMVLGAPIYAIFLFLFLGPPVLHFEDPSVSPEENARSKASSDMMLALYFTLYYIMFFLAGTFTNIPYDAFGPELTDNYDDRSNLFFVASLFDGFGTLFAMVAPGMGAYYLSQMSCRSGPELVKMALCPHAWADVDGMPLDEFSTGLAQCQEEALKWTEDGAIPSGLDASLLSGNFSGSTRGKAGQTGYTGTCPQSMCDSDAQKTDPLCEHVCPYLWRECRGECATSNRNGGSVTSPEARLENLRRWNCCGDYDEVSKSCDNECRWWFPATSCSSKSRATSENATCIGGTSDDECCMFGEPTATFTCSANTADIGTALGGDLLDEDTRGILGLGMTQWSKSFVSRDEANRDSWCGPKPNSSLEQEILYDYEGQGAAFWTCIMRQLDACNLRTNSEAFLYLGALFGVYYVVTMWNAAFWIEEKPRKPGRGQHLIPSLQNAMNNIPFRGLLPAWALDYVTVGIISSMTIFFVQCVIRPEYTCQDWQLEEGVCFDEIKGIQCEAEQYTEDGTENERWYKGKCNGVCMDKSGLGYCSSVLWAGGAVVAMLLCAVTFTPLWLLLQKLVGKNRAWLLWSSINALTNFCFIFVNKGDMVALVMVAGLNGVPIGAKFLSQSILADIIDYDEFLTGKRNEATFTMFQSFIPKMVAIPSSAIPIAIMNALGFVQPINGVVQPQPDTVVQFVRYCVVLGAGVSSLLGFVVKARFPIRTRKMLLIIADGIGRHMKGKPARDPVSGHVVKLLTLNHHHQHNADLLDYFPGKDSIDLLLRPGGGEKLVQQAWQSQQTMWQTLVCSLVSTVLSVTYWTRSCENGKGPDGCSYGCQPHPLSVVPVLLVIVFGVSLTLYAASSLNLDAAQKIRDKMDRNRVSKSFLKLYKRKRNEEYLRNFDVWRRTRLFPPPDDQFMPPEEEDETLSMNERKPPDVKVAPSIKRRVTQQQHEMTQRRVKSGRQKKGAVSEYDSNVNVTSSQETEMREVFDLFDTDKSGMIDESELKKTLKALGVMLSSKQVNAMIDEVDHDKSGGVCFEEFKKLIGSKMAMTAADRDKDLENCYTLVTNRDQGDKRGIGMKDLKRVAKEMGEPISDAELREMIKVADQKGKSQVDLEDFKAIMEHTTLV